MRRSLLLLAALAANALAGCDHVPKDAVESCRADIRVLPAKTDILVVVDDSRSMQEEQENLRANLSTFVEALARSPVPNDFQIGVTTTDVLDFNGLPGPYPRTQAPYSDYAFGVPYPAGALVAVDPQRPGKILYDPTSLWGGTRVLPVASPTLVQDFEANVLLGVLGSGKEQHLQAARLALSDRLRDGINAGFLRSGARLGLIILTDEDDCSETATPLFANSNDRCHDPAVKAQRLVPLSDYLGFLQGPIAGEARDPVVAVIAGFDQATLAPTGCPTSFDVPTRLAALLDQLGPDRTLRGSICDPSFGPILQKVADLLVPQTVPLDGAPSDPHMLVVAVQKPSGTVVPCAVEAAGSAGEAQAGAVYTPPQAGRPATLTFQHECRLGAGDRMDLKIVCAG